MGFDQQMLSVLSFVTSLCWSQQLLQSPKNEDDPIPSSRHHSYQLQTGPSIGQQLYQYIYIYTYLYIYIYIHGAHVSYSFTVNKLTNLYIPLPFRPQWRNPGNPIHSVPFPSWYENGPVLPSEMEMKKDLPVVKLAYNINIYIYIDIDTYHIYI